MVTNFKLWHRLQLEWNEAYLEPRHKRKKQGKTGKRMKNQAINTHTQTHCGKLKFLYKLFAKTCQKTPKMFFFCHWETESYKHNTHKLTPHKAHKYVRCGFIRAFRLKKLSGLTAQNSAHKGSVPIIKIKTETGRKFCRKMLKSRLHKEQGKLISTASDIKNPFSDVSILDHWAFS